MTAASVCGGDGVIAQRMLSCVIGQRIREGTRTMLGTRSFGKIAIARELLLCRCDKGLITEKNPPVPIPTVDVLPIRRRGRSGDTNHRKIRSAKVASYDLRLDYPTQIARPDPAPRAPRVTLSPERICRTTERYSHFRHPLLRLESRTVPTSRTRF